MSMCYDADASMKASSNIVYGTSEAFQEMHYEVDIPLYHQCLCVYVGSDYAAVGSAHCEMPPTEAKVGAITIPNFPEAGMYSIFVDRPESYPSPIHFAACIAHESVHISNRLFHNLGHDCDPENDEPQAYLIEFLVSTILGLAYTEQAKDETHQPNPNEES